MELFFSQFHLIRPAWLFALIPAIILFIFLLKRRLASARSVAASAHRAAGRVRALSGSAGHPARRHRRADAARAFGQRYEIDTAAKLIKRLLILAGSDPQIRLLAGQTLRMIHRKDEAIPHLLAAAEHDSTPPEVHLELAVLLERRHQLDEAHEHLNRYLSHDKESPEATLLKARILSRSQRQEDAASVYHELSERNGCTSFTKAQVLNEWANMLDSQGDYRGAWDKLTRSKALLVELPETATAQNRSITEQAWLNHLAESITADHLNRWKDREPSTPHQSILLTGCPRSGTTLIEKILDAHPEIVSADELSAFTSYILPGLVKGRRDKDGSFDAETLENTPPAILQREEQRYFRYLQSALNEKIGQRILVDKNPSVTFMIPGYQRVWPNNKILYALRDPRDVAISCFFRWLPINSMSVRFHTMEDTFKRTSEELECWLRLRDRLPEDSWHETRYENTVLDYSKESRSVLHWLGLDWDDSVSDYRAHMTKRGVNSPTYADVNKPIYQGSQERWKNYEEFVTPHLGTVQSCARHLGYEF